MWSNHTPNSWIPYHLLLVRVWQHPTINLKQHGTVTSNRSTTELLAGTFRFIELLRSRSERFEPRWSSSVSSTCVFERTQQRRFALFPAVRSQHCPRKGTAIRKSGQGKEKSGKALTERSCGGLRLDQLRGGFGYSPGMCRFEMVGVLSVLVFCMLGRAAASPGVAAGVPVVVRLMPTRGV
jgi:hypothetical protein